MCQRHARHDYDYLEGDYFMEEEQKRGRGRPKGSKDLVPRKTRSDIDHLGRPFGSVDAEAGDNSRYLAHALTVRNLPKIDISDPVQVENRINEYLVLCMENDMKPTVKGFCNALGGISRNTLWTWRTGQFRKGTHEEIIVKAYDLLEEMWENYMQNGKINPVAGIFLGKNNFGYQDKQEMVVTPNTAAIPVADVATIEAKYAELPED